MEASYFLTIHRSGAAGRSRTRQVAASGAAILSDVPYVRQGTDYSCGAASFQAVLSFWGMDLPESELIERLHTSPDHGTCPRDIVRVAMEQGFIATMGTELTVGDLAASVREGVPVIIVAQAWAEDQGPGFSWADDWEHGHYMVVIGIDDELVYLEDPAMGEYRRTLPIEEFEERWHNYLVEASETTYVQHLGIFITGKDAPDRRPIWVEGAAAARHGTKPFI